MLKKVALLAGVLFASASLPAAADTYVFGYSPGGNQTLTLHLAGGGSTTLNATNMGYYQDNGASEVFFNNYQNYIAGYNGFATYNNFIVFDLSSISGLITSANISLYNPGALHDGGDGFFSDVSNAALYTLYDVNTTIRKLEAAQTTATDIYNDLGTGTSYGSYTFTASDNGTDISIALDASAIAALNAGEGAKFAFGGAAIPTNVAITPPSTSPVPEPATLFLLGPAMAGLGWARRRMTRA